MSWYFQLFQVHVSRWLYDFYHRPSDERLEVPRFTEDALGGICEQIYSNHPENDCLDERNRLWLMQISV